MSNKQSVPILVLNPATKGSTVFQLMLTDPIWYLPFLDQIYRWLDPRNWQTFGLFYNFYLKSRQMRLRKDRWRMISQRLPPVQTPGRLQQLPLSKVWHKGSWTQTSFCLLLTPRDIRSLRKNYMQYRLLCNYTILFTKLIMLKYTTNSYIFIQFHVFIIYLFNLGCFGYFFLETNSYHLSTLGY